MDVAADLPPRIPVFIVGGGPVGLALSLLLARFDVDCVVVEKSPTTTDHPKSRGCWVRTMEIFRQWGIEHAIRERGLQDNSDMFVFLDSIAGHEYGRTRPEPNIGQTPAWKCLVAQDAVEEEILKVVKRSPRATILFDTECTDIEETNDGVRVTTRCTVTGQTRQWNADYLLAADGAGSPTRRKAGINVVGPATLAVMSNEYWRADLSHLAVAREAAGFIIVPNRSDLPRAGILNTNGRDRWLTVTQIGLQQDDRERPWTDAEFVEIARGHAGIADLDVTLINRSIWRVSMQVAETFKRGRVFLVGDSAHRFPPTGGFGLNSGVQDAHNLAWKLAFVLKGRASERLLETYSSERKPVAQSNANFSYGNRLRFGLTDEAVRSRDPDRIRFWINDMDNHLHSLGQNLGHIYEEGAVIPDGTVAKALNSRFYTPTDRPGARFPHIWLDPSRRKSTLDWFDREFAVVTGPKGEDWLDAGRDVSDKIGVPLRLEQLPSADPSDGFQIGMRGAVLVRPDGHVAWRMPWMPADPAKELAGALSAILH
jgi:2-polyprenyl-6-methoxyphenol hydroxylase-like FAD-dependent oxidoreductase